MKAQWEPNSGEVWVLLKLMQKKLKDQVRVWAQLEVKLLAQ